MGSIPNPSPSISDRVNNFYTEREKKKNPTSLHLLCMQVKKAGHLKLLLTQPPAALTALAGAGRHRSSLCLWGKLFLATLKTNYPTTAVRLEKVIMQTSSPPPTDLLFLSPHEWNLQGIARSAGAQALLRSLLLLQQQRPVPHPPSSPRAKQGTRFSCFTRKAQITHISTERERYDYISLCCLGQEMKCCLFNWQKHAVRAYL